LMYNESAVQKGNIAFCTCVSYACLLSYI
jgi:hypothetical protein